MNEVERKPTVGEMLDFLRTQYSDEKRVKLLRCPSANNFIELTDEQYYKLVDEFEKLIMYSELGQKPTELEKIGIQMLLGHSYDYYAGHIE
jgi:hypothetical protein